MAGFYRGGAVELDQGSSEIAPLHPSGKIVNGVRFVKLAEVRQNARTQFQGLRNSQREATRKSGMIKA